MRECERDRRVSWNLNNLLAFLGNFRRISLETALRLFCNSFFRFPFFREEDIFQEGKKVPSYVLKYTRAFVLVKARRASLLTS